MGINDPRIGICALTESRSYAGEVMAQRIWVGERQGEA
mgnify:FL=1|jgi:hypothetical protein